MAVSFSMWDYFGPMLFWMLVPLGLYLCITIPLQRFLLLKTKNIGISLLPMLLIIPLLAAGFRYIVPAGERTGCLYPEENAYTHTTAGTITNLRPADHIPLYYYDGEFRGGVLVTMDGVEYYSMAHPMLTEGASLHFTYCPEDNLVMAFSPIEAEEVAALQTPFVMPEPTPEEPVPETQVILGTVLTWTGFGGMALLVFLQERLAIRFAANLLERDSLQRGEVIPSSVATISAVIGVLPVCLAALGGAISSNGWEILLPIFMGAAMMLLVPRLLSYHVRLEGRNIHIRRFLWQRTVPLSSLRSVYWSSYKWNRYRRSLDQRQLVLIFEDGGTLELSQFSHLGLNDLHRRLSAYLHTIS